MTNSQAKLAILLFLPLSATANATPQPTDAKRQVLLYGEIHGTTEIPLFFRGLVMQEVKHQRRVAVGLELTAGDLKTACRSLRKSPSLDQNSRWLAQNHDGRLSYSMAKLTCDLSKMSGVVLFPLISDDNSPSRDQMIADAITIHAQANRTTFALVGNLHARNNATSAAGLLRSSGVAVVTYVFDARQPSKAWIRTNADRQGPTDIGARFCSTNEDLSMGGVIVKDTPGARWDRCVSLEKFSASFPIVRR